MVNACDKTISEWNAVEVCTPCAREDTSLTYLWQDMYSGGDVVVMIIILRDRNLYAVIVQRWISYTMNKLILMLCVDHVHVILWTLGVC